MKPTLFLPHYIPHHNVTPPLPTYLPTYQHVPIRNHIYQLTPSHQPPSLTYRLTYQPTPSSQHAPIPNRIFQPRPSPSRNLPTHDISSRGRDYNRQYANSRKFPTPFSIHEHNNICQPPHPRQRATNTSTAKFRRDMFVSQMPKTYTD